MKNTASKIIEYIKSKGQAEGKELFDYFEISDRAIRKQLKNLFEKGILTKVGKPPKVFYSLKKEIPEKITNFSVQPEIESKINDNFLIITPSGEEKEGIEGFKYWCKKFNLPVEKTAKEYSQTLKKYDSYKVDRLINGLRKFKSTFKEIYLDEIYYLDFYSIERFGKTKLGQLLLYAKQSQNRTYIKKLIAQIKPEIDHVIKKFKVDGVGIIPPTVKREVQIMKELEKSIKLNHKLISITKIKTTITVPQKTLSKLDDRIENARNTIIVNERGHYKNILLIDDAVGSGSTLNEIARKIREGKICKGKVIGLAIVGSFKGFDVISEV